jgi:FkbM family methyltransferase
VTPALRHLAAAAGYDLVPRRKPREPLAQLVHTLGLFGVGAVIDVGANEGQYATALRAHGWAGPILSVEPILEVHARLAALAADDRPGPCCRRWRSARRTAARRSLEVSAESDMSSLLPQGELLRRISPTSAVARRVAVPLRRLDRLDLPLPAEADRRLFLKLDVQGASHGSRGCVRLMPRVAGLQVEMALVALYEGESLWQDTVARLADAGFALHLLIPGYYERKLGRQLQVDGVFYRRDASHLPEAQAFTRRARPRCTSRTRCGSWPRSTARAGRSWRSSSPSPWRWASCGRRCSGSGSWQHSGAPTSSATPSGWRRRTRRWW